MSKYDAIGKHLNETGLEKVTLTITQLNEIVELPPSASGGDRTWYGNTKR